CVVWGSHGVEDLPIGTCTGLPHHSATAKQEVPIFIGRGPPNLRSTGERLQHHSAPAETLSRVQGAGGTTATLIILMASRRSTSSSSLIAAATPSWSGSRS